MPLANIPNSKPNWEVGYVYAVMVTVDPSSRYIDCWFKRSIFTDRLVNDDQSQCLAYFQNNRHIFDKVASGKFDRGETETSRKIIIGNEDLGFEELPNHRD